MHLEPCAGCVRKEGYILTNQDIWRIALGQSAVDSGCRPEDFLEETNKIVISKPHPDARKYLALPFSCDLVSYGRNIVASVQPEIIPAVQKYLDTYTVPHCFETPNLHVLDESLRNFGLRVCFMAEYFLPDVNHLRSLACPYEIRLLHPSDFAELYLPAWSNALCEKRKELDVLAAGAYDGDRLVGLAGCSADCADMRQIGIDVLPDYRRQGIAAALTSRLTQEILAAGKVPFYCAAWSNLPSVRNALKCGYKPAWVEITAKESAFVEKMNLGL